MTLPLADATMTRRWIFALWLSLWAANVHAASLQVAPVLLDVAAPGQATTLTLRNEGAVPFSAQVRVFKWTQANGQDQFVPADDVVASPPQATLTPRATYTVRLVRSGPPPATEAAYRVIVDELPDPNRKANGTVSVVIRYSVPLFFASQQSTKAQVSWRFEGGALVGQNSGGRRLRISNLSVGGRVITKGLAGYVLAGASFRFALPRGVAGGPLQAMTDNGPLKASPTR